ncbi:CHAT domain-containing protein [Couchioplanes caeruleus]|uniref:CHAT domain-containing protein n=1 Tax=Couchioplanes caeruleus TaxID=56438 RepID=UPI0020C09663|nr:CHAT domain-containing protein [Couchioplanes caeruleus]UQU63604.1 CHAT domain-containing protein [Couchioplanes caeruleus]
MGLVLSVADGATASRWRWVLKDDTGVPLADFPVELDTTAFEYQGFANLYQFLRWNADPADRMASEAALLTRVGAWIGSQVLGGAVAREMVAWAPVSVRVVLPPELEFLLYRPLELAHVDGGPLVRSGIGLVFEVPTDGAPPATRVAGKAPVRDRLRMLAVFSLPTGESVLGLRRERYELVRMVRRLATRSGRAVELEVLQYGVTRPRLNARALDDEGWDVLHVSGHGRSGGLVLEKDDGSPDVLDATELIDQLGGPRTRMRRRLKLAVVSACESGAASAAEALRWVGLDDHAETLEQQDEIAEATGAGSGAAEAGDTGGGGSPAASGEASPRPPVVPFGGVARELARALDCAVVAMRYPVADEFAVDFGARLYELLLEHGQPVDAAVQLAVNEAAAGPAAPVISLVTPALFGARAVDLRVRPPTGQGPSLDPRDTKMAWFPDEPQRFVGRSAAMAAANRVLAPRSPEVGVLLHGMAGAGKTACALELAYRHENTFQALVFWEAPKHADAAFTALQDLALKLDTQLGDFRFTMQDKLATVESLQAFLPRLTQLLEQSGVLLVLDNLETLLDEDGVWRDERWAPLIGALTGHSGESRVLLTSRIRPAGLDSARVLVQPVHALSLTESMLLARELPHLGRLLGAHPGPERGPEQLAADRGLVRQVLHLVQGHPKLLELADAAAADPARLARQLDTAAGAGADEPALRAFFTTGTSDLDPAQFLAALHTWTSGVLETLPAPSRLLLQLLCRAEDTDRNSLVLADNWADLWRRLDRDGDPPDLDSTMVPLIEAALADPDTHAIPAGPHSADDDDDTNGARLVIYRIHPGVAEVVTADTELTVNEAADAELAAYWRTVQRWAIEREAGEDSGLVVSAGLAAAPYLLRLQEWDQASTAIDIALRRDTSPAVARTAITYLDTIAAATGAPDDEAVLGRALRTVDPDAGEARLRHALQVAVTDENYRLASGIAGEVVNALRGKGRLQQALDLATRKAEYTALAGLGPWTVLTDEARVLQIRLALGESQQVLDEVNRLRARIQQLPARKGEDDTIEPANVREGVLDIGMHAASNLERWEEALQFNAEQLASLHSRDAGRYEIAFTMFNNYGPMIRLGRLDEGEKLLQVCQPVFEDAGDTRLLAMVFSARAQLESYRGHPDQEVAWAERALTYGYLRPQPDTLAALHGNLAIHLDGFGGAPIDQVAHRLAGTVLEHLMRTLSPAALRPLAQALHRWGDEAVPGDFAELCARVDRVEGVHFGVWFPEQGSGDQALREVLERARAIPDEQLYAEDLVGWEPVIAAVVAGANGDNAATVAVNKVLDGLVDSRDWGRLVEALRRILHGERDDQLHEGLDPTDTAIVKRTLGALAGTVQLADTSHELSGSPVVDEWEPVIAAVVAATDGDPSATAAVNQLLAAGEDSADWGRLVGVLRRVLDGERGRQLLDGLDATDRAIIAEIVARLAPPDPSAGDRG